MFKRGGDELAIPPKQVHPATQEEVEAIYNNSCHEIERFCFASLTHQRQVRVPVHGDKFFNKHIAIVGATGSGKSSSVCTILQMAVAAKNGSYAGLNNSHIVIFDIHSEYKTAFPNANVITSSDLVLPFWMLNDDEMENMFLETGDANNYNQKSLLRQIITLCKCIANPEKEKINFDTPISFDIEHFRKCLHNLSREIKHSDNSLRPAIEGNDITVFENDTERLTYYCQNKLQFCKAVHGKLTKGPYADGSIDKFMRRIDARIANLRLEFMFGSNARGATLDDVLRQILGYTLNKTSNTTIIDLNGIPFDFISITVSLITRLLFDYCYYSRKEGGVNHTPLLLVFEEAHKYAPKSDLARYKASLKAIERVAKEGRKYGVSLLISSQRPSEISETIFSQCSNFLAMRLTNPDDQAYVRGLLPDTLGNITSGVAALEQGEALLIGDAVVIPCVVYVDLCSPEPSSSDIKYFQVWKQTWTEVDFTSSAAEWQR
ncbi:MAG: ATP-binding protein [Janthinobacterium lividum]